MIELFFGLGLANNILLILIFVLRRRGDMTNVKRVGIAYLLLAAPAILTLFLAVRDRAAWQYPMFLGIFLVFLVFEWLLDYVVRIDFRRQWSKNWIFLVPYLGLYYAMNYGFVVMVWDASLGRGILMLALFIVQITVNILSHFPMPAPDEVVPT